MGRRQGADTKREGEGEGKIRALLALLGAQIPPFLPTPVTKAKAQKGMTKSLFKRTRDQTRDVWKLIILGILI